MGRRIEERDTACSIQTVFGQDEEEAWMGKYYIARTVGRSVTLRSVHSDEGKGVGVVACDRMHQFWLNVAHVQHCLEQGFRPLCLEFIYLLMYLTMHCFIWC